MKALVVGGTGFVGMNVVRALVAAGHDVAATRRVHTNTLFARRLGAPLVRAELDDVDALTESDARSGRRVQLRGTLSALLPRPGAGGGSRPRSVPATRWRPRGARGSRVTC